MRNFENIRSTLASQKEKLFPKYGIKKMAIFGSYARGDHKRRSDIDILVDFKYPIGIEFIDLANYLENLLKLRVDLVSQNGIKQKYYREIKNELKYV